MRRIWAYLALLAAALGLGLTETAGTDAAALCPARVLTVEAAGGTITVKTDQNAVGLGRSLDEAVRDLREGTEGVLFLETAEHVIVAESARYLLPRLAVLPELRPSAKVYLTDVPPVPATAADFLAAHPGDLTLQRLRAALLYGQEGNVPQLVRTEGGLRLVG